MIPRPPTSTLFPYTTLFRSSGTTRDAIDTRYTLFGFDFRLIDTAGIRKRAKVHEDLEFYSVRSEEHTSELQSRLHLVCRLLLEKKNDNREVPQEAVHDVRVV